MSDNRWIIWQNACEKMHSHFLTELRRLLTNKAVTTHAEILEAMEDIYHPEMPEHTVDIAEDVKIEVNRYAGIIANQTADAVNNAVLSARIEIKKAGE